MNNKILKLTFLIMMSLIMLAACSDDEPTDQTEQANTNNSDGETSEQQNSDDETNEDANSDNETNEEDSKDEFIENQSGLKIGETGTVVSSEDKDRYEITFNEIRYGEDMENVKLFNEVFVVVDVTVKNIDDKTIDTADIFSPSIGKLDTNAYTGPVGSEFVQDVPGIKIIEGELEPGESISGNYVFDINKADNYHFAFGTTFDQITTRAEWEFSAEEIE